MIVAVDTGGTKTLVTSFDESGAPNNTTRFETPQDVEDYLEVLGQHLKAYDANTIDCVIIAIPGIIRNNTVLWCQNLPRWNNVDIAEKLRAIVDVPIVLENDANLAGLAEARSLSTPPELCVYVTISTGIGTGIIVDGKLQHALGDSEGGKILVEYDGQLRPWESFASGRAIKATYDSYARDIKDPIIWDQIADKISRGFLSIIPMLQPNLIVIGGSIGTFYEKYHKTLDQILSEHLPNHIPLPDIIQAVHPEEAVLYGCYYHGLDTVADK